MTEHQKQQIVIELRTALTVLIGVLCVAIIAFLYALNLNVREAKEAVLYLEKRVDQVAAKSDAADAATEARFGRHAEALNRLDGMISLMRYPVQQQNGMAK